MNIEWIKPTSGPQLLHIARNMRDMDAREIYGMRWLDSPEDVANDCLRFGSYGWVASLEGEPVAAIGALPMHPGVWDVWCFGTKRFRQISLKLTKHVKRVMIPGLVDTGCHRAQCLSLAEHTEAHAWLELLGLRRESVLEGFGRNQEDYYAYVWRPSHVHGQQIPAEG